MSAWDLAGRNRTNINRELSDRISVSIYSISTFCNFGSIKKKVVNFPIECFAISLKILTEIFFWEIESVVLEKKSFWKLSFCKANCIFFACLYHQDSGARRKTELLLEYPCKSKMFSMDTKVKDLNLCFWSKRSRKFLRLIYKLRFLTVPQYGDQWAICSRSFFEK